jgi:hypothetical protein
LPSGFLPVFWGIFPPRWGCFSVGLEIQGVPQVAAGTQRSKKTALWGAVLLICEIILTEAGVL